MTQYIYNKKTELLTLINDEGRQEILSPATRDTWGNPYFNLDPEIKSNWIQFSEWTREKGAKTQHNIIRAFLKQITTDEIRQITTYYAKEQPLTDQQAYIFTFDFSDEVFKNKKGEWAYKFKEGQPELT